MKSILAFSTLAISFIALSSFSCSKKLTEENNSTDKKTSLLWEISGNGLKQPSYLYGTIHLIDKKDFYIRPFIDSMLQKSKQAVFEIKLDDMAAIMSINNKSNLPEGVTIQSLMRPDDFQKLKKYFSDSLQSDIMTLNDKKPFVIYQAMSQAYINGETESFDLYFLKKCIQNKTPIAGLETVDDQLGIFDSIPYEKQFKWMLDAIDSAKTNDKTWSNLIQAYKEENLEQISKLMQESSPETTEFESLFITNRNNKWIPRIENFIKDKQTFIAVGAGHLPDEIGLINLLRKRGYTVKPV